MKLHNWLWLLVRNVVIAGVVIGALQWLKQGNPERGIEYGLVWGAISGLIFTGAQYHRWRKNIACALCEELPKRDEN